jgi:hypothetical protein
MSGSCRAGDAGGASLTTAWGRNHRAKLRQHDQPERECAEVISHRRFSLGQLRRAAGEASIGNVYEMPPGRLHRSMEVRLFLEMSARLRRWARSYSQLSA